MRVLFTAYVPSHFTMMVPLAWALRGAGHEVMVAGMADVVIAAHEAGLPATAIGTDGGFSARVTPGHMAHDGDRAQQVTGAPASTLTARELAALRPWGRMSQLWPQLVRNTHHHYVELATAWRPDVIVCETDHNGLIAGGLLGIPVVYHRWGPDVLSPMLFEHADAALAGVCAELGLDDGMPEPDLIVDSCPPSLRFPDLPAAESVRFVAYNGSGDVPDWALDPPSGPRIAVSMGALGGQTLLADWRRALTAALADVVSDLDEARVLLPGAGEFGPLPSSFTMIRPTPLSTYIGSCDLIIHHGGAGTALTAAAHGVPQLVLPQANAAYVGTAERIAASGAGLTLPYDTVTDDPGAVAAAVHRLLAGPRFAARADELAAEIADLPAPADVVDTLLAPAH